MHNCCERTEYKYGMNARRAEYAKRNEILRKNIHNIRRSDRPNTTNELELIRLISIEIGRLIDEEIKYS